VIASSLREGGLFIQITKSMPKPSHHHKTGVDLDQFHRHEALDRVSVWLDHFSEHIAAHPVIVASPDFSAQCEKITDLCGALYQAIGQETHDHEAGKLTIKPKSGSPTPPTT